MHYFEVAPNRMIRPTSTTFTYSSPTDLPLGQLVTIEVGKKQLVGVVLKAVDEPAYATKPVSTVLEGHVLPRPLIKTAEWMSAYYATHLASVLQTMLPRGVEKKRRERKAKPANGVTRERTTIVLNDDQRRAVTELSALKGESAILHGVTGAGKTQVYIELAKHALKSGRSAIILVPEIALTSQLTAEFSNHFENVILSHSRQTEAERHAQWLDAMTSRTPRIVIGPRSALFLPLSRIGLIVVDESHEPSFKQEQSPRYSALRVASILGTQHGAAVVFGSATPAIADYYTAQQQHRPIALLPLRARSGTVPAEIRLLDMTKRTNFKHHRFLSDDLLAEIELTRPGGRQALIFHNRRGSATTTLCENCGWVATDPENFIPLTLHADDYTLRSHISTFSMPVPTSCPVCGHADIIHKGIGTKMIESELRRLYPKKIIARFDGDTTDAETVDQRYKDIYEGNIEILIGTQVVAKGLDLPHLQTVGVIQADAGLSLPDYGASERTFQLLAQVIGRVGRTERPSTVIVQSYQPSHPAVVHGIAQDYQSFYEAAIPERNRAKFPPFVFLLRLTCIYKTEAGAVTNARKLVRELRTKIDPNVEILGPAPAFYEYQAGSYRWQLTLKSPKRQLLLDALAFIPPAHWQFELDPNGLS